MSKVVKIVLEINGKEISLSLEEAKELKRILEDAFVDKKEYVPWHYNPWPTYPLITYTSTTSADGVMRIVSAGTSGTIFPIEGK